MRRIVYTLVVTLLLLTVATLTVSHLSNRRPVVYTYHDKVGTQWEVGAWDAQFGWENEVASFQRQLRPVIDEI